MIEYLKSCFLFTFCLRSAHLLCQEKLEKIYFLALLCVVQNIHTSTVTLGTKKLNIRQTPLIKGLLLKNKARLVTCLSKFEFFSAVALITIHMFSSSLCMKSSRSVKSWTLLFRLPFSQGEERLLTKNTGRNTVTKLTVFQ